MGMTADVEKPASESVLVDGGVVSGIESSSASESEITMLVGGGFSHLMAGAAPALPHEEACVESNVLRCVSR